MQKVDRLLAPEVWLFTQKKKNEPSKWLIFSFTAWTAFQSRNTDVGIYGEASLPLWAYCWEKQKPFHH